MRHILFLCVANSCRSQMAEAIGKASYPNGFHFESAGAMPGGQVDPGARAYLEKQNIPVENQRPKSLEQVMALEEYDAIVTLCEEACVNLPNLPTVHRWNLADPSSDPVPERAYGETFEKISSQLGALIESLQN